MTNATKKKLVRRILQARETIRAADAEMVECLGRIERYAGNETITVDGQQYAVEGIFDGGDATWRPARVHRFQLVKVKEQ